MPKTNSQKAKTSLAIRLAGRIIDVWLPAKMAYDHIPGMSVAILNDGKVAYQKSFGFADVARKRAVKTDTLFRVASMSKMFTATSILQLQEQGKLKITDLVSKHVPWVTGKTPKGDLSRITIKQLLTHTSGLFRDGAHPYWSSNHFPKTLKGTLTPESLIFRSPSKFKYSNHAFSLLGEVIWAASGLSYGDYVQKNIIAKLGLRSTYPDLVPETEARLAWGYGRTIPGQKKSHVFNRAPLYAYAPAAGCISSASDIGLFLSDITSAHSRLLNVASRKLMSGSHAKIGKDGSYGFGMEIMMIGKNKTVGHGGGFYGFVTKSGVDPQKKITVVILANTLDVPSGRICRGVFDLLYYLRKNGSAETSKLKAYEGIYRNAWEDSVIACVGKNLISFGSQASSPMFDKALLKPVGKDSFRIEAGAFESHGEKAVFSDFIQGKPHKIMWGAHPLKRVKS